MDDRTTQGRCRLLRAACLECFVDLGGCGQRQPRGNIAFPKGRGGDGDQALGYAAGRALGIPVYEVRPGVIKTDMTAGVSAKYDQLLSSGQTIQPRWGTSEDVGKAVAALTRGDFPYSSGSVFMVDGGLTVQRL